MVEIRFTEEAARAFVALLNMNKIRDHEGALIIFSLTPVGDEWMLTETRWTDR